MLPEIGASELVVIAAVALIVVGPKDLPVLMRKIGQFMSRMRMMAAEFRASFDEMARQSELDELRKEVEALRRGGPVAPLRDELEPTFRDIERDLSERVEHTPMPETGEVPSPDWAEDVTPVADPSDVAQIAPEAPPAEPAPAPKKPRRKKTAP